MNIENFTPISNDLYDRLLKELRFVQLKVMLVIIRQTRGWHKESDWISINQFRQKTGCSERAIRDAIHFLVENAWIEVEQRGHRKYYKLFNRQKSPSKAAKNAPSDRQVLLPTKDTLTKNTCTREILSREEKLMADLKRKEISAWMRNGLR